MPHLTEALASGALRYCPICDGYEVIDRAVGVVAQDEAGVGKALYLRDFTDRISLFPASPEVRFSPAHLDKLRAARIAVSSEAVSSIRLWNGTVTVRHGEHETRCDALYCALGMRVHSELAGGAALDEDGYLLTDRSQMTSREGIYAAGDVMHGLNQISVAVGSAAIAAWAIHRALGPGRR